MEVEGKEEKGETAWEDKNILAYSRHRYPGLNEGRGVLTAGVCSLINGENE